MQYVDTTTGQVFASKPIEGKVGEAVTYSIPQESKKLTLDAKRLPKGTEQNGDNFVWNGVCTAEKQTITFYYGEVKEGTITFNLVDNATGKIIRTTEKTPKIGEDVSYAAPDSFKHFKINAKRLPMGTAQEGENFIWRGIGGSGDQIVNFYYDEAEQGTITFNLVDNITGKIIRTTEKTPKIGEDVSYAAPDSFKHFKINAKRLPMGTAQEGENFIWRGIGGSGDQIVNFYYDEAEQGTITFNLVDNITGKIIRTTEKTPKIGEDVSYAAPDSFKHFKINAKRLPIGAAQEGENFIWRGVGKLDDQTVNFYYDEAEQGTITFNLVDNITGKIIRSIEKTPKIGEDISYTIPEAFKNFKLNTRRLQEGTTQEGNKYVWTGIGKLDDQIVNFYYDETIPGVTNTETKDITRTIDLVKDGKVFKEEIQTVHFTRTATTDQMTGKTTYTDWETTHAKFDDFKLSDIEGYTHKNKMIKAMPVKVTDKDVVVTELYTKVTDGKENNGNNNQGTTNGGKSNKGINTNKNNNQKHANLGYHKAGDPKKNHFANKGNTATKKLPMTGEKISKIVASSGFGVLMLTAAAWVISKRKRTN
ncbi:mucin-binding protein [Melissococcus plutonius]|uniref:mucin-binding protein n=1 Tax=Melissococcus plutonius TaxID=33970 RepID=UPI0009BC4CDC|nr:MucBP domain-containing protein [Melissococcus plutonius]